MKCKEEKNEYVAVCVTGTRGSSHVLDTQSHWIDDENTTKLILRIYMCVHKCKNACDEAYANNNDDNDNISWYLYIMKKKHTHACKQAAFQWRNSEEKNVREKEQHRK